MTKDFRQAAIDAALALDKKFGKGIVILDIGGISSIADYFIITEAGNPNQVSAMTDGVEEVMEKHGVRLRHIEGMQRADWVLMDFGDIIVHIFNEESRAFYDLERTWSDAKEVSWRLSPTS